MARRNCELCAGEAAVFCMPDSAFLCWSCDARVHDANFLVARHLRQPLCSSCQKRSGDAFSGAVISPFRSFCNLCKEEEEEEEEEEGEESSSAESYVAAGVAEKGCGGKRAESTSVATTEDEAPGVAVRRRRRGMGGEVDARAEESVERWARRLGLRNGCTVPLAMHAFGICAQRLGPASVRLCLAGSLWLGVRLCERKGEGAFLRKLEAVCGIPARIILLAESKVSRMLKLKVQEEGWAECSSDS